MTQDIVKKIVDLTNNSHKMEIFRWLTHIRSMLY